MRKKRRFKRDIAFFGLGMFMSWYMNRVEVREAGLMALESMLESLK